MTTAKLTRIASGSLDETKKFSALAQREAERVGALVIAPVSTPEEYAHAANLRRDVKVAEKSIDEAEHKITNPLNEALKEVRNLFRPFKDVCSKTLGLIDSEMRGYTKREEEKRRAEEQRLRELAEKENARLKRVAERQAEKASAKGDEAKAAEIRNSTPLVSMPVIAQSTVPKLAGTKVRANWKARLLNPRRQRELLAVAIDEFNARRKNGEPKLMGAVFWSIDEQSLGAHARTTKGELPVPDVEFYDEPGFATEIAR